MLIDSANTRWVEVRRQDTAGAWSMTVYSGVQSVTFDTVGLTVPMAPIYEDSDLPPGHSGVAGSARGGNHSCCSFLLSVCAPKRCHAADTLGAIKDNPYSRG